MARDLTYRRLIQSRRWRNLRIATLKKRPYCEGCKEKDLIVGATEVHHIVPVETGASDDEKEKLMFDPMNLRSLCHDCHMQLHRLMRIHTKETVKARQRQRLETVLATFFPGEKFEGIPRG